MTAPPILLSASSVDLGTRFHESTTVVASPAAAAQTIIASLTIPVDVQLSKGVFLIGSAAWTVGTNGTASTLILRQTDTSGTVIASTGAVTTAAASLRFHDLAGFDTAAVLPGQVYVLTLTVANGSAESTVSGVCLAAFLI